VSVGRWGMMEMAIAYIPCYKFAVSETAVRRFQKRNERYETVSESETVKVINL
jgi:hypothetical protein